LRLDDLNQLDSDTALREFLRCCGSRQWAGLMAAARPFGSAAEMAETADAIWQRLEPSDWLEAFAAHPRIGADAGGAPSTARWSAEEQRGAGTAAADLRSQLAAGNRDYEARFGYIFIVCASGKSAARMLQMLEQRLANDAAAELRVAAEEQRQITHLRLRKLIDG